MIWRAGLSTDLLSPCVVACKAPKRRWRDWGTETGGGLGAVAAAHCSVVSCRSGSITRIIKSRQLYEWRKPDRADLTSSLTQLFETYGFDGAAS
eukprot:3327216-Pleurochrysis_carterae.AAC.1